MVTQSPSPAAILLREREVAQLLGVSRSTVARMADRGVLERIKLGGTTRYRRSDIEALAGVTTKDESPNGNEALVEDGDADA